MEKIEEKQQEKKYVGIYCSDSGELELAIKKRFEILEKDFHNDTKSILEKCSKAMLNQLLTQRKKGYKVDFILMGGKISFLVEKEAAKEILEYQKKCIEKIKSARYFDRSRVRNQVRNEFISYIRKNYSKSFSDYALVEFYDATDFTGSAYGECDDNDDNKINNPEKKAYAKGMIDIHDYCESLKLLDYAEGVLVTDPSIKNQISFLKHSMEVGASSYFGFAIPLTLRARYGKNNIKSK